MDGRKDYIALPIPPREELPEKREGSAKGDALPAKDWELESFAEVEIGGSSGVAVVQAVLPAQPILSVQDEKRARFYSMWKIGRDLLVKGADYAEVFCAQARFMVDFEDDFPEEEAFLWYFPNYHQMEYRQLRTYFTWRSKVRRGLIEKTSLSYGFLYIYELINNIGVASPADGMEKLLLFWKVFRVFHSGLDRYARLWIKDYFVFYALEGSFVEFVETRGLREFYPFVFLFSSGKEDSLPLFNAFSKYDIRKSVFFTEQNQPLINGCFFYVLSCVRQAFREKKKCFEDILLSRTKKDVVWVPFCNALFYAVGTRENRVVRISEREAYSCAENRWSTQCAAVSEDGRVLVGYLIKEIEAALRRMLRFKYKLSVSPDVCSEKLRRKLEIVGVVLPDFVHKCVWEYHALCNRKRVAVDAGQLKQIRREALEIQEKLIVSEADSSVAQTGSEDGLARAGETELTFVDEAAVVSNGAEELLSPELVSPDSMSSDLWLSFWKVLSSMEKEAVGLVLADGDVRALAVRNRIMLELLLDGINQKAMDFVGDTILETEGMIMVYDDYRENLMALSARTEGERDCDR